MKIAVDAMGADYGPGPVIEGVVMALSDYPEDEFVLVGHSGKLPFYLEKYGIAGHPRISIVHAETVCEMSEPSTTALRAKKNCSITVCARLLKEKAVDAMVTPGHTGATVAATKVLVRTLPGVDRPALAASLPTQNGKRFLLVDAGANIECTPINIVQFAILGEVYAQYLFRLDSPRVSLLSVGGEDIKGNDLTKESFKLLEKRKQLNFVGNVEANVIFENVADVLIADGFSGNVMLKGVEGLAKSVMFWLKRVLSKNALRMTGAMLAKNAFIELKSFGDADDIGGAPLLGLNGIWLSITLSSILKGIILGGWYHSFRQRLESGIDRSVRKGLYRPGKILGRMYAVASRLWQQ